MPAFPSYNFKTNIHHEGHIEHTCGCAEMHEQEMHHVCDNCKARKAVNPWAVCTASVGRKNRAKYERCVRKVKHQQGMR